MLLVSYLIARKELQKPMCRIPKFYLISWCGNFMEAHSNRGVLTDSVFRPFKKGLRYSYFPVNNTKFLISVLFIEQPS